jgi:purine-binding chemotaxis protein CheW|tara:strand:- start:3273 stop:3815 length:543 start_codon:yes stop_codon:yes gene_type:complete
MSELMTGIQKDCPDGQVDDDALAQYLTFSVGDERFAIGIMDVREIIEVESLARVPMTPEHISGVINLRGNVVPVVDLAVRLGRNCSAISEQSCIVVVEVVLAEQQQVLGMLVDSVEEILEIPEEDVGPPPNFGTDIRTEFITRMGWVGDRFIILLDTDNVLSAEDMATLEVAASDAEVAS